MNTSPSSYHRFLIKQRVYCELGEHDHLGIATHVIKDERGRDIVVCDEHAEVNTSQSERTHEEA